MQQALKDRLCKAIHLTLTRSAGRDPIDVTERIADAVELLLDIANEDSGIATVPEDLRTQAPAETPWDFRRNQPAAEAEKPSTPPKPRLVNPPPARGATELSAPAPKVSSSVIALPGTPEYAEADPSKKESRTVITAVEVRRKTGNKPGAQVAAPQWADGDLMDTVIQNTPETIEFEPDGLEGKVALRAKKNCHCLPGIGAELTYKHEAVSDNDGFLIAKHSFSIYDKELDIDAAIDDILRQLKGKYRPRNEKMEPDSGPEPGPLRLDMRSQPGERVRIELTDRDRIAGPEGTGADMVLRDIRRSNDALAPAGRRV